MKTNGNAQAPPPEPYSSFTRAKAVFHGIRGVLHDKTAFLRKRPEVPTSQWQK